MSLPAHASYTSPTLNYHSQHSYSLTQSPTSTANTTSLSTYSRQTTDSPPRGSGPKLKNRGTTVGPNSKMGNWPLPIFGAQCTPIFYIFVPGAFAFCGIYPPLTTFSICRKVVRNLLKRTWFDKLYNLWILIIGVWIRGDELLPPKCCLFPWGWKNFKSASHSNTTKSCVFQTRCRYCYSSNVHTFFQPCGPALIVASNAKSSGLWRRIDC